MADEETFEPLFEFEAPQYVDLNFAASEQGFYDGADEWFDKMATDSFSNGQDRKIPSLPTEKHQALNGKEKSERNKTPSTNQPEEKESGMITSRAMAKPTDAKSIKTKKEVEIHQSDNQTKEESETVLTETTNQLNDLSLDTRLPSHSRNANSPQNTSESISSITQDESNDTKQKQPKHYLRISDASLQHKGTSATQNLSASMMAKRVPIIQTNNNAPTSLKPTYLQSTMSSTLKDRHIEQQPGEPKRMKNLAATSKEPRVVSCEENTRHITNMNNTVPHTPRFLTAERALRYQQRLEELREQSKLLVVPRTPRIYGKNWKPETTKAKTPHFRSDLRLRHCVERALKEREAQQQSSHFAQEPGRFIFGQNTARRAEVYRNERKKSILSFEEMELQRIEQERKELHERIMKSIDNFHRAQEESSRVALSNTHLRKRCTVPKEFRFATNSRVGRKSQTSRAN
eukprot:jgi/Galph1/1341/GphlegSOOS_G5953.1